MTCPVWAQFRVPPKAQRPWAIVSVEGRDGPLSVRVLPAGPVWWSVLYGPTGRQQAAVWRAEQVDISTLELSGVGIRVEVGTEVYDLPCIGDEAWRERAMRWVQRAYEVGGRVEGLADRTTTG